jgi:outer membrane protein assembly factor BamA
MLARVAGHLQQLLQSQGKHEKVIGRLVQDPSGQLVALFRPAFLPSVAEVQFQGNQLIPTPELQQVIAGTAVGSVYSDPRFRQILDNTVRPAYEQRGRIRVSFPKLDTSPARNVNGIIVTVHVDEGPEYKLGEVEITGPMQGNRQLLKQGAFKTGDMVNFAQVNKGIEAMLQSLRRNGYIQVKAGTERIIDDKEKSVGLRVNIEPGPQFTFGSLTIQGLDIQTEPHVRKLWAMKTGQPFNVEYPGYFLSRLKSDQLFDNLGDTRSVLKTDLASKVVDVTLILAGEKRKPAPKPGSDPSASPPPGDSLPFPL